MPKFACISGDVHHDLGNLSWDAHEPEYALEYARTLEEKGAKGTVFVTGKCARRSTTTIREIGEMDCMEVGGHTYQAFKLAPTVLPNVSVPVRYGGETWNVDLRAAHHYFLWVVWRSFYGPLPYQKWNVARTLRALGRAGVRPTAWRTHGYDSDERTFAALDSHGFFVVSDVRRDEFEVYHQTGNLWQATITGPTDEQVDPEGGNGAYREAFFEHIETAVERDEPVLFQMHPKRQAMMDFEHLERAVDVLEDDGYEFVTITELVSNVTGEAPPSPR